MAGHILKPRPPAPHPLRALGDNMRISLQIIAGAIHITQESRLVMVRDGISPEDYARILELQKDIEADLSEAINHHNEMMAVILKDRTRKPTIETIGGNHEKPLA